MPNFQLVVPQYPKNKPRESALFNFFEERQQMQQDIWEELRRDYSDLPIVEVIMPSKKRKAYLITLKLHENLLNLSNDPRLTLRDRHIRIDKDYGVPKSTLAIEKLFTHWHYTERYAYEGDDIYEAHVYFHHGILQTFWLKDLRTNDNQPVHLLASLSDAQRNCNDARNIVNALQARVQAHKDQLSLQLETMLHEITMSDLATLSDNDLYNKLSACEKVAERLNKFNEDYYDTRYAIFARNIVAAKEKLGLLVAEEFEDKEEGAQPIELAFASTSNSVKKPVTTQPKSRANVLSFGEISKQIERLKQNISRNERDAKKLLDLNKTKDDLVIETLAAIMDSGNQEQTKKLGVLHDNLSGLLKLKKYFIKFIDTDLAQVKILFPTVKDSLNLQFYSDFIAYIALGKLKNNEKHYAQLCEFFYAESSDYRLFVSLLNTVATNYSAGSTARRPYYESLFTSLCFLNRFEIFKTLVEQNADINDMFSFITSGYSSVPLVSLACVSQINPRFINFLLDTGANVEFKPQLMQKKLQKLSEIDRNDPRRNFVSELEVDPNLTTANNNYIRDFYEFPFALYAFAESNNTCKELFARLVPNTSAKNLILAFIRFTMDKDMANTVFWSKDRKGLSLAQTANQRESLVRQARNIQPSKYLGIVFGSTDLNRHTMLSEYIQAIRRKLSPLQERETEALLDEMLRFSFTQRQKQLNLNVIVALRAALVLACFCESSRTIHAKIMYALTEIANIYKNGNFSVLPASTLAEYRSKANTYYANAFMFACESDFRKELINTGYYKNARNNTDPNIVNSLEFQQMINEEFRDEFGDDAEAVQQLISGLRLSSRPS